MFGKMLREGSGRYLDREEFNSFVRRDGPAYQKGIFRKLTTFKHVGLKIMNGLLTKIFLGP